jgi:hypothetical protein
MKQRQKKRLQMDLEPLVSALGEAVVQLDESSAQTARVDIASLLLYQLQGPVDTIEAPTTSCLVKLATMFRDERTNFKFKMAEVLAAWLMNPQLHSSVGVLGREPTAGHMRQAMYESVSCYSKLNQHDRNSVLGLFALMLEKVGHAWAIDPDEVALRQKLRREQQADGNAKETVQLSRTEGMKPNETKPGNSAAASKSQESKPPGRLAGDGRVVVLLVKLAAVEMKLVLDGVADVLHTIQTPTPDVSEAFVVAQRSLTLCCMILQSTIKFLVSDDDDDSSDGSRSWGRLPGEILLQLQPTLSDSFTVVVQFLQEVQCVVPASTLQARSRGGSRSGRNREGNSESGRNNGSNKGGGSGTTCTTSTSDENIAILRELLETAVGTLGYWLTEESVGDSGLQQNVSVWGYGCSVCVCVGSVCGGGGGTNGRCTYVTTGRDG